MLLVKDKNIDLNKTLNIVFKKKLDPNLNRLKRLRESGLLTHWFNQITPKIDKCLITSNNVAKVNNSKMRILNLVDASSIFLLLIVGIISSLFGFLAELTIHYLKKKV